MKSINQSAPVKCSLKIIINSNSVAVWEVLTDINNWTKWQSEISKSQINGLLQPETTFDWKSGGLKIHSIIHTVTPYTEFGWTGKSLGIYAIHNWKITELNKQTEIEVEESMEGILVRLLRIIFNKSLNKSLNKWLELLKKECELSKTWSEETK